MFQVGLCYLGVHHLVKGVEYYHGTASSVAIACRLYYGTSTSSTYQGKRIYIFFFTYCRNCENMERHPSFRCILYFACLGRGDVVCERYSHVSVHWKDLLSVQSSRRYVAVSYIYIYMARVADVHAR